MQLQIHGDIHGLHQLPRKLLPSKPSGRINIYECENEGNRIYYLQKQHNAEKKSDIFADYDEEVIDVKASEGFLRLPFTV